MNARSLYQSSIAFRQHLLWYRTFKVTLPPFNGPRVSLFRYHCLIDNRPFTPSSGGVYNRAEFLFLLLRYCPVSFLLYFLFACILGFGPQPVTPPRQHLSRLLKSSQSFGSCHAFLRKNCPFPKKKRDRFRASVDYKELVVDKLSVIMVFKERSHRTRGKPVKFCNVRHPNLQAVSFSLYSCLSTFYKDNFLFCLWRCP